MQTQPAGQQQRSIHVSMSWHTAVVTTNTKVWFACSTHEQALQGATSYHMLHRPCANHSSCAHGMLAPKRPAAQFRGPI
jgi:hypothetical protein